MLPAGCAGWAQEGRQKIGSWALPLPQPGWLLQPTLMGLVL